MWTRTPTGSLWNDRTWAVSADRSRQSGSMTLRVSSTVGSNPRRPCSPGGAGRLQNSAARLPDAGGPTSDARRRGSPAPSTGTAPAGHHWKPPVRRVAHAGPWKRPWQRSQRRVNPTSTPAPTSVSPCAPRARNDRSSGPRREARSRTSSLTRPDILPQGLDKNMGRPPAAPKRSPRASGAGYRPFFSSFP